MYRIEYSPEAREHLLALPKFLVARVLDDAEEQLSHHPQAETQNRKPMRPNPLAVWELRIGRVRVYYEVEDEPERVVRIRAIGVKRHNAVWINGEVVEL